MAPWAPLALPMAINRFPPLFDPKSVFLLMKLFRHGSHENRF